MKPEERDRLIQETHQGLFGVAGTEEKGMVGDVKDIKAHQEDHSKRITVIEVKQKERRVSKKEIGGYVTGAVAIMAALWKSYISG